LIFKNSSSSYYFFIDKYWKIYYYILSNTKYIAIGCDWLNEVGKQLKKGIIEILILKLISEEKMYGYQLIHELDVRSNGIFKMKEGTLYPVLYRLEDNKMIESIWEQDTEKRGVPRKYYRITEEGLSGLTSMRLEFNTLISAVKAVLREEF
jgi:PadR family transcriptional regulator PadR